MFPFISSDGTLYYSTNGIIGLGLLDIFRSRLSSRGVYIVPENMGKPINSDKDDFGFWIYEKENRVFFSSNSRGGKGDDDIYSFLKFKKSLQTYPIYFDYGKSYIREDSEYELKNLVSVMKKYTDIVIKIESHTDSRSSKSFNLRLSDRRAKSTRDYIISKGINPKRVQSAIGYGESRLLNNCHDAHGNKCSEEEHQLNRRSFFMIVKGADKIKAGNKKPTVINRKPGS